MVNVIHTPTTSCNVFYFIRRSGHGDGPGWCHCGSSDQARHCPAGCRASVTVLTSCGHCDGVRTGSPSAGMSETTGSDRTHVQPLELPVLEFGTYKLKGVEGRSPSPGPSVSATGSSTPPTTTRMRGRSACGGGVLLPQQCRPHRPLPDPLAQPEAGEVRRGVEGTDRGPRARTRQAHRSLQRPPRAPRDPREGDRGPTRSLRESTVRRTSPRSHYGAQQGWVGRWAACGRHMSWLLTRGRPRRATRKPSGLLSRSEGFLWLSG